MIARPVGYYVHHHGAGHWARARVIAPLLNQPCTVIGTLAQLDDSTPGFDRLDLPDDRISDVEGRDGERSRPACLHYAPLGSPSIRQRMAQIVAWIEANDPVMLIVDVSVEVALLARLLSVPSVVVRLGGDRTDLPHLEAFRSAERLLAPFPPELEHPWTPAWVAEKTIYAGFLTPRSAPADPSYFQDARPRIVVMSGQGGDGPSGHALAEAARAVPDFTWDVLGPVSGATLLSLPNLRLHGWVTDIGAHLAGAALVIGTGGDGVIADVALYGSRFVCIPENRPFGEQHAKAVALHRLGAAIYQDGWNNISDWPVLVASGLALDPGILAVLAQPGASRVVAELDATSDRLEQSQHKTLKNGRGQKGRSAGSLADAISTAVGSRSGT